MLDAVDQLWLCVLCVVVVCCLCDLVWSRLMWLCFSSCSEEDILKELEELSLEAQGGKGKVTTPQLTP